MQNREPTLNYHFDSLNVIIYFFARKIYRIITTILRNVIKSLSSNASLFSLRVIRMVVLEFQDTVYNGMEPDIK